MLTQQAQIQPLTWWRSLIIWIVIAWSAGLTLIYTFAAITVFDDSSVLVGERLFAVILLISSGASTFFAFVLWRGYRWGFYGNSLAVLVGIIIGIAAGITLPMINIAAVAGLFASLPPHLSRQVSTDLYRHKTLSLILLLALPLLLLVVIYLGSLGAMLINSFFYLDSFTGQMVREPSLRTYAQLFKQTNFEIILRTVRMAALVTLADAILAFPVAYYMARYSTSRTKAFLYFAVLFPLWSSYLVRVYAWRLILAQEGILTWFLHQVGLQGVLDALLSIEGIGGTSLGVSPIGTFIVFTYTWLPYMILPIATALERVPQNVLDASADLGARPSTTFWRVTLPLAFPGVVAGSIFSFSLTLGDFIIPGMVGNSARFIGQAVLVHQGTSGNLPLAAAFTVVPIAIMALYLFVARKLGAFDAL